MTVLERLLRERQGPLLLPTAEHADPGEDPAVLHHDAAAADAEHRRRPRAAPKGEIIDIEGNVIPTSIPPASSARLVGPLPGRRATWASAWPSAIAARSALANE